MSLADELKKLSELLKAGTITGAEFEAAKKRLLDDGDQPASSSEDAQEEKEESSDVIWIDGKVRHAGYREQREQEKITEKGCGFALFAVLIFLIFQFGSCVKGCFEPRLYGNCDSCGGDGYRMIPHCKQCMGRGMQGLAGCLRCEGDGEKWSDMLELDCEKCGGDGDVD